MAKAKAIERLEDLQPDRSNVNRGTERGNAQLDWSLTNLGAWRSIAASADGVVAAGNQTLQQAADRGLKIRPVHTSGDELVVVIRDDIDSSDPRFRQYAIADNRISETNYSADIEALLSHAQGGIDISALYRDDEIKALLDVAGGITSHDDVWQGMPEYEQQDVLGIRLIVHFETKEDVDAFARLINQTITDKTKAIWFPYKEREVLTDYAVE